MKRVLIAGEGPDPLHIYGGCVQALEALGTESVLSLDESALERCSGLILPGGVPDVDPARYHEPPAGSRGVTPELDEVQFRILDRAVQRNLPVLGICRGCQLLNVYFGGSLIQNLETADVHRFYLDRDDIHDTACVPGTFAWELYGKTAPVNTKHHQAIRRLAPDFGIAQLWFDDSTSQPEREALLRQAQAGALTQGTDRCIPEAVYHRTRPIWGVQWHPELLVFSPLEGTADPMAVFRLFVSALSNPDQFKNLERGGRHAQNRP